MIRLLACLVASVGVGWLVILAARATSEPQFIIGVIVVAMISTSFLVWRLTKRQSPERDGLDS